MTICLITTRFERDIPQYVGKMDEIKSRTAVKFLVMEDLSAKKDAERLTVCIENHPLLLQLW